MLSIKAIKNGEYYVALAAEDYYLNGGEPEGRWLGNGARRLRLGSTVGTDQIRQLLQGFAPDGQSLVRNAGYENRQAGWDLTFSAPKSLSVLWANCPREHQQRIQDIHFRAVRRAIHYLEQNHARSRIGKAGVEQEQADLVVATFEHGTSRALDPQLHTHALVLNVGVRRDGTTGTILSRPFYRQKMIVGALYRMELGAGLRQELGLKLRAKKNWFEIEGVPQQVIDDFSTRRKQIEKQLGELGIDSAAAAAIAALLTRELKDIVPPRLELFEQWQEQSTKAGFSPDDARALLQGPVAEEDHHEAVRVALKVAIDYLEEHHSYFTEDELLLAAAYALQATGVPVDEFLPSYELHKACSTRLVNLGVRNEQKHYSTRHLLNTEHSVLKLAQQIADHQVQPVRQQIVDEILSQPLSAPDQPDRTFELRPDQVSAVEYLTCGESSLRVVTGLAGTGKTAMLLAARQVFEADGFRVVGVTPTHRARQELSQGAGIDTDTLAMRLLQFESALDETSKQDADKQSAVRGASRRKGGKKLAPPIHLDSKTVVVLDEASMVDTPTFNQLLPHIERSGARLVVVGDEKQLPPIGPGGVFDWMVAQEDVGRLAFMNRQKEEWNEELVFDLSQGRAENFLRQHALRGSLRLQVLREEAERELINDWRKRGGAQEPHRHVIAATTNAQVDHYNELAQQQRLATGQLEAGRCVKVEDETFYVGDRVTFRKNSRSLKVFNGDLGTVVAIKDWGASKAVAVRLDGEEPTSSEKVLKRLGHHASQLMEASQGQHTKPYVDDQTQLRIIPLQSPHGSNYQDMRRAYAFTTHKLQGATVDHVYVALGDAMTDRELTYVQGSRHRESLRLYSTEDAAGLVLTELARHPLTCDEELKKQPLESPLVTYMEQSRKRELASQFVDEQPKHRNQISQ